MLKFDPKERINSGQAFQRAMDWGWNIQEDSKVTNKEKFMKKRYDKFLREKKQEETLEMQMMKQRQYQAQQQKLDELKRLALQCQENDPDQWKLIEKILKKSDEKFKANQK